MEKNCPSKKIQILLIEDSAPLLGFLKSLLEEEFKTRKAAGKIFPTSEIQKAIEIYQSEKVDLVLCDFYLGNSFTATGFFQILSALPQTNGKSKNSPLFIVMSGDVLSLEDQEQLKSIGLDYLFLKKPSAPEFHVFLKEIWNYLSPNC